MLNTIQNHATTVNVIDDSSFSFFFVAIFYFKSDIQMPGPIFIYSKCNKYPHPCKLLWPQRRKQLCVLQTISRSLYQLQLLQIKKIHIVTYENISQHNRLKDTSKIDSIIRPNWLKDLPNAELQYRDWGSSWRQLHASVPEKYPIISTNRERHTCKNQFQK